MSALYEAIARRAQETPAELVLSDEYEQIGCADLKRRVDDLSLWLKQQGASAIGLQLDNRVEWVLLDIAAQHSGVCVVPVPLFFSPEQVEHLLKTAGVELLFTESAQPGRGQTIIPPAGVDCHLYRMLPERSSPLPEGVAKISFTSGSTGTPKGACLTPPAIERVADSLVESLSPLAVRCHLVTLPLATLLENIAGIEVPIRCGARVELRRLKNLGFSGSSRFNSLRWAEVLKQVQPQSLIILPQLLQAMIGLKQAGMPLSKALKFVAVGGGRVSPQLIRAAQALDLPVYEGYGLTENCSVVAVNLPGRSKPGTVGQPLAHLQLRFAEDGELFIRGNSLMQCYLGEPAIDPHDWFATGDIGRLDKQGYLVIEGRKKNIFINSFGRNLSPEWVESEAALLPGIEQIVLVGDGRPFNTAVIVSREPELIDPGIKQLNANLPDYARIEGWCLADEPFDLANGCLTANGRPRRDRIIHRYQPRIEALYYKESV